MQEQTACPECGAAWPDGQRCADAFYQLLGWEFEHQMLEVHHLLVLCYHLQHPSLYSPAGLDTGKQLLVKFLEKGMTPQAVRRDLRQTVDSGRRDFKIKGTPAAHGSYARPVGWTMTVGDVVRGGVAHYDANVRAWAASILQALRASGNLA